LNGRRYDDNINRPVMEIGHNKTVKKYESDGKYSVIGLSKTVA
jgi:hypothetical protein